MAIVGTACSLQNMI